MRAWLAPLLRHSKPTREVETSHEALLARLDRAECAAQTARLHPHFVFNSLHTVQALVAEGRTAQAQRAIARLGELLRASLENPDQAISLRRELAITRDYVELQQLRFGQRLKVDEDIDERCLGWSVPALTIQLLVENAIKHGALATRGEDDVSVKVGTYESATSAEGEFGLEIVVRNGLGAGSRTPAGFGIGLDVVQRRLHALVDPGASLSIERTVSSFTACVKIPQSPRPLAEESAA